MGWMLHSTRTVLAVSWLPRCPGGERLNTSGLLLLPPLCTLLFLRQTSSHPPRLLLIGWNGLMLLIHVHKVLGQRQQRRPPLFDSNGSPSPLQRDTYTDTAIGTFFPSRRKKRFDSILSTLDRNIRRIQNLLILFRAILCRVFIIYTILLRRENDYLIYYIFIFSHINIYRYPRFLN